MKAALVVLGILLVVALIVGGKLTSTRNELVQQRESINGAWSQVDVDLQRRADLIPNLVETAKMAGDLAVQGAQTLKHNGYKVPLMRNLVKRAVRGSEGGAWTS